MKTAIDYTDLCLAFQLETNAPLDQLRAETALWQIVNFWPASLDPHQFEMLRAASGDHPSHAYATLWDR